MVKRVLLLLNQSSGAGHSGAGTGSLQATLARILGSGVDLHSDLARWRYRLARPRRLATHLVKIEALNDLEYRLALLVRSLRCVIWPEVCELIEIEAQGRKQSLRLLAGVVLRFPIRGLPFERQAYAELSLYVIPYPGRFKSLCMALAPRRLARCGRRITVGTSDSVGVRFTEPESVEFFLDEDPETAHRLMTIRVAGTLAFVPGPSTWARRRGIHHEFTRVRIRD